MSRSKRRRSRRRTSVSSISISRWQAPEQVQQLLDAQPKDDPLSSPLFLSLSPSYPSLLERESVCHPMCRRRPSVVPGAVCQPRQRDPREDEDQREAAVLSVSESCESLSCDCQSVSQQRSSLAHSSLSLYFVSATIATLVSSPGHLSSMLVTG